MVIMDNPCLCVFAITVGDCVCGIQFVYLSVSLDGWFEQSVFHRAGLNLSVWVTAWAQAALLWN